MGPDFEIEVYEWAEGLEPQRKLRSENVLTHLTVPAGGPVPAVGDVLSLHGNDRVDGSYKVIERVHLATMTNETTGATTWGKMWLHVRRIDGS